MKRKSERPLSYKFMNSDYFPGKYPKHPHLPKKKKWSLFRDLNFRIICKYCNGNVKSKLEITRAYILSASSYHTVQFVNAQCKKKELKKNFERPRTIPMDNMLF